MELIKEFEIENEKFEKMLENMSEILKKIDKNYHITSFSLEPDFFSSKLIVIVGGK